MGSPEDQVTRIRGQFDRLAPDYDVHGPGSFRHFGEHLVDAAGIGHGDRVLDVATGRGALLFPAARRLGGDGLIVGIDLSEGMIRATSVEAERLQLPVELHVMDATELDFPDASFDAVTCGFALGFFPDQGRALEEFRRVLVPGGRVAISTWRRTQVEDLSEVLQSLGIAPGTPPGSITDAESLSQILAGAGLTDIVVVEDRATFRYADLSEYWRNARGVGIRTVLDSLDAATEADVRRLLAERFGATGGGPIEAEACALLATARN